MKILHTSDWHLGQSFMGKSREDEHKAFLQWLLKTIKKHKVTVLIVAGDIFDTNTPANYALELYYNFLKQLLGSCCKYIIITAGNHDSIATLKAPKQLLELLNVYVITSGDEDEDEIVPIYENKKLQGIICAVPFLRDYVVRDSKSGQGSRDKELSLSEGIKRHYKKVYKSAKEILKDKKLPIIATGHLTTVGSKTSQSEREIYIGGALDIDSDFFAKDFDYVALGHLHTNQKVGLNHVRYSGSPIALSFSEAGNQKKVNIVTFNKKIAKLTKIDIPIFRPLVVLCGDLKSLNTELEKILDKNSWIEIHLDDKNPYDANHSLRKTAKELDLNILMIKIDKKSKPLHADKMRVISLDELTPKEVFNRRLELDCILDEKLKSALMKKFETVLDEITE